MVTLRAKKLSNGSFSLYLDIYKAGQRNREFLNIHVSRDYTQPAMDKLGKIILDAMGKPKEKRIEAIDKDKWQLACSIRMKRELEINTTEHGFVASFKKSSDFIEYFQNLLPTKKHHSYDNSLRYLKEFVGQKLSFKAINEELIDKFQDYLLNRVGQNTALMYSERMNFILNQAVKDKIILSNPFKNVEKLERITPATVFLETEEV